MTREKERERKEYHKPYRCNIQGDIEKERSKGG
jgi:hypothetical protein